MRLEGFSEIDLDRWQSFAPPPSENTTLHKAICCNLAAETRFSREASLTSTRSLLDKKVEDYFFHSSKQIVANGRKGAEVSIEVDFGPKGSSWEVNGKGYIENNDGDRIQGSVAVDNEGNTNVSASASKGSDDDKTNTR